MYIYLYSYYHCTQFMRKLRMTIANMRSLFLCFLFSLNFFQLMYIFIYRFFLLPLLLLPPTPTKNKVCILIFFVKKTLSLCVVSRSKKQHPPHTNKPRLQPNRDWRKKYNKSIQHPNKRTNIEKCFLSPCCSFDGHHGRAQLAEENREVVQGCHKFNVTS